MKKEQKKYSSNSFDKYENQWIALSRDEKEIIEIGRSFIKTFDKAIQKGEKDPVMLKVPPSAACLIL